MSEQYAALKQHSSESNATVRQCLRDALLSLMAEKSHKDMSVSQLCRKAGVSRMAFYRNYGTIEELVHEAAVMLNATILQESGSPFRLGTSVAWYTTVFHNIFRYRTAAAIMFQQNFQHEWMKIVNEQALHDVSFSTEERYQRLCWCGGFGNVVTTWLQNGMRESPEEMALYCSRYLPHTVVSQTEDVQ